MRIRCLGLVFLTLILATPFASHADEREQVALLSVEIADEDVSAVHTELEVHIARGLANRVNVLGLKQVQRELGKQPNCFSQECLVRIGEALSVHRFVRAHITVRGAHYDLKLELFQIGDEPFLQNTLTITCAVCTIAELGERSMDAAQRLLLVDNTSSQRVTISSIPDGGVISIDGLEAGLSPVVAELVPGPHQLRARKEGYSVNTQTVEVKADIGETQIFELPLRALAPPRDSADYGYWKWASAAGAGILLAVGTTLVVMDGDPTCSGEGRCASSHDTMVPGIATLSGGLLAGAAAAWMFWDDSKNTTEPRAALQFIPGGATAGIALGF